MRLPLATVLCVAILSLAASGCGKRIDYDVGEVAPPEHLSGPDEHPHHQHDQHGAESAEQMTGARGHVHTPGVRNHGTMWFFNQPWAARFIWSKILRDSAILVGLAILLLLLSRHVHSRRWS
ncbi:hypothetical protein GF402_05225 [Candidatus Fermentibacteria bacterium]|nr:hypothetical protein [Candidatus Fermentibacteria bacterium]